MAAHSLANPAPENTEYDTMRHESMVLKRNGLYGITKFFVNGFAPDPWCKCGCGFRKVWCPNNESNK
jgi:hypothetical protein